MSLYGSVEPLYDPAGELAVSKGARYL